MWPLVSEEYQDHSKRNAYLVLCAIITIFIVWHAPDLSKPEEFQIMQFYEEYYLNDCSLYEMPELRAPVKLYMLCVSKTIFDNTRIIPFVFTISLIPLAFAISTRLTKKYQYGLIAAAAILGSKIIGFLGPTGSLSSDWAFYFLLSIYMMYKKPIFAAPFLFLSIASKGLPLLMIPVLFFWVWRSDMPAKKISYVGLGLVTLITGMIYSTGNAQLLQPDSISFDPHEADLTYLHYVFRNDIWMFLVMPLAFANWLITIKERDSQILLACAGWFYGLVVLIPIFSIYEMYDYRMIPMIVLCCIGVGTIPKNPLFQKLLKTLSTIPVRASRFQL